MIPGDEIYVRAQYFGKSEPVVVNGREVPVALVLIDGSKNPVRIPVQALQDKDKNVRQTFVDYQESRNIIAKRIRKMRQVQNLSQTQFADLLGVSQATVSQWERGIALPRVAIVPLVCKVLNTDVSALLGAPNAA